MEVNMIPTLLMSIQAILLMESNVRVRIQNKRRINKGGFT